MIRVLHVYKTFYPDSFGGIEQTIRQLANGCEAHNIVSEVFTLSPNPQPTRFESSGISVNQARSNFEISSTPFSVEAFGKFRELSQFFDLIHYHYPFPFGDLIGLVSGKNKPSIITYHSDIVRQKWLKYMYFPVQTAFLNSIDRIVCTSDAYLESSPTLRNYRSKTLTIPLGLDEQSFKKASSDVSEKWRETLKDPFFLFLGVLRKYKGVRTLLEAAQGLNSKIVIAGDGPELLRLKNKSQRMGLNNVYFTGLVSDDDKAALLDLCLGLVLPSQLRSEAFGLVQLEAAMRSKPLICTELSTGTSYVNIHGKTGMVIPPANVGALRNAMNVLAQNPQLSISMGCRARERFIELFTSERMCDSYSHVYQETIKFH